MYVYRTEKKSFHHVPMKTVDDDSFILENGNGVHWNLSLSLEERVRDNNNTEQLLMCVAFCNFFAHILI